jgi:hypothetical protein
MSMSMSTPADLDELSYDVEADGVLVREQLDRVVLSQGAWSTVMFLYRELDRATGAWRAPKMTIVRFQRWRGGWRKHAAFNVADEAQARRLTSVFEGWYPKIQAALDAGAPADDEGGHEAVDEAVDEAADERGVEA